MQESCITYNMFPLGMNFCFCNSVYFLALIYSYGSERETYIKNMYIIILHFIHQIHRLKPQTRTFKLQIYLKLKVTPLLVLHYLLS